MPNPHENQDPDEQQDYEPKEAKARAQGILNRPEHAQVKPEHGPPAGHDWHGNPAKDTPNP